MIFLTKKSFDFNHDLNQWLKSAWFKLANPACLQWHTFVSVMKVSVNDWWELLTVWLMYILATSQLVTRSSHHTVNLSPVNSSQTRLITKSTRHKWAHNKTTSTSHNYLHAVSLRRHPETVLNTDGIITAICVTLMYTADSRSRQLITLLWKARSTSHNAVKHDGQLVTRFYDVTSWLVPYTL